jgi:hypothetical protein
VQILSEASRREIAEATFFAASKVSNSHSLRQQEMMPLDPAVFPIPEGRYNHAGQAVLLLVDSVEGAAREILHREEKLAWIQRFRVERCKGILDLSSPRAFASHPDLELIAFGLGFYGTKKPSAHAAHERKPEYSVARFIADGARHQGFSGIHCKSTKHYANNLILFAWHDDMLTPVGEPQLCNLNQPDHVFH